MENLTPGNAERPKFTAAAGLLDSLAKTADDMLHAMRGAISETEATISSKKDESIAAAMVALERARELAVVNSELKLALEAKNVAVLQLSSIEQQVKAKETQLATLNAKLAEFKKLLG